MSMRFEFTSNSRSTVNSTSDVARAVQSFSDPAVLGYSSGNTAEIKDSVDRMIKYLESGERLKGNVPFNESKSWNMNDIPLQRAHGVLTQKPRQYQSFEINARFLGPTMSLKRGDFIFKINAPKHPTSAIRDNDNIDWDAASNGRGNYLKHSRKFSSKRDDVFYVVNTAQLNWFLAKHDISKMFGLSKLNGRDIYSPQQLQKVIVPLGTIESIELETASPVAAYDYQLSGHPCALTEWNETFYAKVRYALRNVDNLGNNWSDAEIGDELYLRFYNCTLKANKAYSFEVGPTESTSGKVDVMYVADTVRFQVEDLAESVLMSDHFIDKISQPHGGKCSILHVGTLFSFINKPNNKKRKRSGTAAGDRDINYSTRQSSHDAVKGYIIATWCK